jgi:uncharacterized protein (UPF0548 family)
MFCYSSGDEMFLLKKPSSDEVDRFIASQRDQPFSYPDVGATLVSAPSCYAVDHNRVAVGRGQEAFKRAVEAVRCWKMFALDWIDLCPPNAPIERGTTVAVVARHLGFFSLNACRIVSVLDEARRFGFTYGTLPEHAERGEERFTVECDIENDTVWYDILAFSRPNHFLAKAGYPITRRLQRKFAEDSKRAMIEAVRY